MQGAAYCQVAQPTGTQPAVVTAPTAGAYGTCIVQVAFPAFSNASLTATAAVNVLSVTALTLRTQVSWLSVYLCVLRSLSSLLSAMYVLLAMC